MAIGQVQLFAVGFDLPEIHAERRRWGMSRAPADLAERRADGQGRTRSRDETKEVD